MKEIWETIKKVLGMGKRDSWAEKQFRQMAKLRGRMVVM